MFVVRRTRNAPHRDTKGIHKSKKMYLIGEHFFTSGEGTTVLNYCTKFVGIIH